MTLTRKNTSTSTIFGIVASTVADRRYAQASSKCKGGEGSAGKSEKKKNACRHRKLPNMTCTCLAWFIASLASDLKNSKKK